MEGLIEYLAKSLVDRPEQVEIVASDAEGGKFFELKVAPEDIGKIIGRDGRTINAMRTLLAATAQRQGLRVRLEVRDDRKGPPGPSGDAPAAGVKSEV